MKRHTLGTMWRPALLGTERWLTEGVRERGKVRSGGRWELRSEGGASGSDMGAPWYCTESTLALLWYNMEPSSAALAQDLYCSGATLVRH